MPLWMIALCLAAPADDPWLSVYQAAGLSAERARVDLDAMALYGGGRYRTKLFDFLMGDPRRVPELGRQQGANLVGARTVGEALGRVAWLGDHGVRRGLVGSIPDTLRKQVAAFEPFHDALSRFRARGGAVPGTVFTDPPTDDLPKALQVDLALLLVAIDHAVEWRQRAFEAAPAAGMAAHVGDLLRFGTVTADDDEAGAESIAHQRRLDRLVAELDLPALNAGAMDLALVIDDVSGRLAAGQWAVTSRRYATPLGDVVIGGTGDDVYEGRPPALIVELGGSDRYASGAAAAAEDRPVSVIVDLSGDDRYETDGPSAWGAGVAGIGLLVDLAGNDVYRAGDLAEGCGVGGVGLLFDGGGDDQYTGRVHAQGAAAFGVGVLCDRGGSDRYEALQRAQGYGYTLGTGALIDAEGDDSYLADDRNLVFKSPQTAEHNASLSQGFGFGRRADYTDGRSLAGGTGWLVDGGGADRYDCGVFGQGAGYWYGVGMLVDLAGDDRYHGIWYVQASAAHFAVGGLVDQAGADDYQAEMNMAQGAGHDFSLGFLADLAGNDRYRAPNLGLGAGNANGVGYCWDAAGDDVYETGRPLTLGAAQVPGKPGDLAVSPRRAATCLGLFLDGSGTDRYPRPECGDQKTWRRADDTTAALGFGMDR